MEWLGKKEFYLFSIEWGDLRDFGKENVHEIETWWNKIILDLGFVRDAVIAINVEGEEEPIIFTERTAYDEAEK